MKFKAKSMLAMAVLLSVMSVGTMAEAAEISGYMNADDITEASTVIDRLYLQSGELNYTLTSNDVVSFEGATKMNAAVNGGLISFNVNIIVTDAGYINGNDNNILYGCTVALQGGTLTKKVEGSGNLDFTGDVSTDADNIAITGTNTVASGAKLTFYGGTLTKKVEGAGNLDFATDMTVNADNIANTGTNTVESGKTIKFNSGIITQTWNGAGNLDFATDMTVNADNIANTGTNTVESGKTLTFTGGNISQIWNGAGNLDFAANMTLNADNIANTGTNTIENGKTTTFNSGTIRQNWDGAGTTEFNNTVSVADGVQLGTATNNVNGTLDVAGNITAGNINFKNDSTLKVDGRKITSTAAIRNISSATVESGAKLYVRNAVGGTPYKILAGSGINVSSWQTDEDMGDGFRAIYGLKVGSIVNDGTQFTIQFEFDPSAYTNIDVVNILSNASPSSALYKYVDALSQVQPYVSTKATIINTMANMNSLANVQQGTQAVMAMATDALQTNIGTGARPLLGHRAEGIEHNSGDRYQGSGVRKVSANDKDSAAIETVEQGKSDEVMPVTVENEPQKYDKTVWANYIHSKKTIDGLKTGRLTQNSTIQYNGVTVGADLWSNAKGFGGLALTTAIGKTNSSQDGASVKNDTDYHGVSLYQRYDYKDVALLFDLSYTHAKNDVTMSTAGTTDVTAKPKSDAYSAGVKVEYPVKIGHSSQLTPYTGVRYTHIHTDKYDNSLGISNDIKDQNLVNIPIGVQLKTEYTTNSDWKFGHIFEGGYVWNIGNRQSEQRLGYMGVYDSIDFDVTDRGEYFLKTAFTARHKDTDFELGYRYTRGDNTKDNKWNFNVTYNFGNANGMPYKSVLLGKIDLLESANKALRAENVELKAENIGLKSENAELKAENERKDLELAEVKAENERLKALLENK